MMDEFDRAFQDTVHECPQGPKKLATEIRMTAGRLYNISNPEMPEHRPSVEAFRAILLATNDHRCLDIIEKENGRIGVPLPPPAPISDGALLEMYARVDKERGDVGHKMIEMMRDGRVTRSELPELEKEMYDEIRALLALFKAVERQAEQQ